jgi:hypothetical protein
LESKDVFGFPTEHVVNMHTAAASLLARDGRSEVAEPYFDGIVFFARHDHSMGSDHLETLTAIEGLAQAWRTQHRYQEAMSLYCESLVSRTRIQGENHPETLRAKNTLHDVLLLAGDLRSVEAACEDSSPDAPR